MVQPLPPQHTAPATTSEQFATAMRNRALFNLAADLADSTKSYIAVPDGDDPHPSDLRCYAQPAGLILERWQAAVERCLAELQRADTFAHNDPPADPALLRKVRQWRLTQPVPEWRTV